MLFHSSVILNPCFRKIVKFTPHPAYDGYIKTLRDHLFFRLVWSEKVVRGVSYFRVNGSGAVDSIAIDGFVYAGDNK